MLSASALGLGRITSGNMVIVSGYGSYGSFFNKSGRDTMAGDFRDSTP